MKYLIIYTSSTVLGISEFTAGTAVVTPYNFLVETLENAATMLGTLSIDTTLLTEFNPQ
ncbi:hypothetical protein ACSBL2_24590 [Pedobacter sp. AW31-3R]|uniref:hypothetical protein n=1 Tax=Pedobacter sp. AW31-3R TaxID=3445781 RepID=UPI003FA11859